jgi:hypothetical protein
MRDIEVYLNNHTPTMAYAKDPSGWHIVFQRPDGWRLRRSWHPIEPMQTRYLELYGFHGHGWMAEQLYGIPADRVKVFTYEQGAASIVG